MKILKYSLLFFSIVGLVSFFGCGSDATDPTVDALISANGKAWTMISSSTDDVDPAFSITFSQNASNATTFTINPGTSFSPVYNTCSATTGDWAVSGALTNGNVSGTISFISNGVTSTVNASYTGSTAELTITFNTPVPSAVSEEGCGDKNNSAHSYTLKVSQ